MTRLQERLRRLLVEHLDGAVPEVEIGDDTPLYGRGLGLDSVDVVSLIARIEEEFDVFFEAEEIEASVASFAALHEAVRRKAGAEAERGERG